MSVMAFPLKDFFILLQGDFLCESLTFLVDLHFPLSQLLLNIFVNLRLKSPPPSLKDTCQKQSKVKLGSFSNVFDWLLVVLLECLVNKL